MPTFKRNPTAPTTIPPRDFSQEAESVIKTFVKNGVRPYVIFNNERALRFGLSNRPNQPSVFSPKEEEELFYMHVRMLNTFANWGGEVRLVAFDRTTLNDKTPNLKFAKKFDGKIELFNGLRLQKGLIAEFTHVAAMSGQHIAVALCDFQTGNSAEDRSGEKIKEYLERYGLKTRNTLILNPHEPLFQDHVEECYGSEPVTESP